MPILDDVTTSPASRRLASACPALAPKCNPYSFPGPYQMLLAADILRDKFENSFSNPEAMVPNRVTKLDFPFGDGYHTFLKGHRIMVQVQSSWFPMFDRNPQKFCDIYQAQPSDYRKATQKVFWSAQFASHFSFSVLR